MIKIVDNEILASECDKLLTKLICDEKKYNEFLEENFVVKDYFKNIIQNDKNILLCYEENKKVIGYVFFKYQKNENSTGYLVDGLYVLEEYRNRGIAKKLLNEGFKKITNERKNFVDINVMYKNKIAIKLYESLGFEIFSIRMRKK